LSYQFVLNVPDSFLLTSKTKLAWDSYVHLENALLGTFQLDLTPGDQILCMHHIALELSRYLETHDSSDNSLVQHKLEGISFTKLQEMLAGVRNVEGSASRRDLYLAILIQLVEATYSRKLRDDGSSSGSMFLRIMKHWKGLGSETFAVFKLRVNHAQLQTVA